MAVAIWLGTWIQKSCNYHEISSYYKSHIQIWTQHTRGKYKKTGTRFNGINSHDG
jgi:hypothetical protein